MQSNVTNNLALFGPYIFMVAVFMIVVAIISIFLIRSIKWKSGLLKIYGIFIGMRKGKYLALVVIILRMIFVWHLLFNTRELALTHIIYGAIITMLIHILLADISLFFFDIFYTIILYGELLVSKMIYMYINDINSNYFILIMLIVMYIYIMVTSVYCAIECIASIIKQNALLYFKKNAGKQIYVILVGLFMAAIPYVYINSINVFHINQEIFQYTAEGKTSYEGRSKITKAGDACVLENKNKIISLDRTPIYFTEDSRILIPNIYSIIQPNLALTNRLGLGSRVYTEDGQFFIDNDKSIIRVSDFFMFDGRDTYIFFEQTAISWNDNTIEISPFSYITVKHNRSIEIFDRDAEQYKVLDIDICDVTARLSKGASVNLSTDILIRSNGQEQFLFLQPNLLEELR